MPNPSHKSFENSVAYKLLIDYNFCNMPLTKSEEWWKVDDTSYVLLANPVTNMNVLVKFDPAEE